jgi:hypothetical protein
VTDGYALASSDHLTTEPTGIRFLHCILRWRLLSTFTDSWATPGQKLKVDYLSPEGKKTDELSLTLFERNVQVRVSSWSSAHRLEAEESLVVLPLLLLHHG